MEVYGRLDPALRQIRVLELFAGAEHDIIRCKLHVTTVPPTQKTVRRLHFDRLHSIGSFDDIDALIRALPSSGKPSARPTDAAAELVQTIQSILETIQDAQRIEILKDLVGLLETLTADSRGEQFDEKQWLAAHWYGFNRFLQSAATSGWFEDGLQYDAISYCWGTSTERAPIWLNDICVDAPQAAVDVLRSLRQADRPRHVWIDAICINQRDPEERMAQICLMGDIYRHASKTIIWLGAEDGATIDALAICRAVVEQLPRNILLKSPSDRKASMRAIVLPDVISVKALSSIFARPWFYRQWVYQEVASSKHHDCRIGSESIGWIDLELVAEWAHETRQWLRIQTWVPELPRMTLAIRCATPLYRKLHTLAVQTRELKASEPRDKIVALLPMTLWAEQGALPSLSLGLQYTHPIEELICLATKAMAEEDRNLSVLARAESELHIDYIRSKLADDWPSWCPAWHIPRTEIRGTYETVQTAFLAGSCAESATWRGLKTTEDVRVLSLKGFAIDAVDAVIDAATAIATISSWSQTQQRETVNAQDGTIYLDQLRSAAECLAMLFSANSAFLDQIDPALDRSVLAGCINHELSTITPSPSNESAMDQLLHGVTGWLTESCLHRSFFRADKESIGIGSKSIKKGDKIVAVYGNDQLVILRPVGDQYRSLGPCHVHEVDPSQLLSAHESAGDEVEVFEIR